MDFQEICSLLFGLATACLGFFVRRLIQELDSQKRSLEELRRDSSREQISVRTDRIFLCRQGFFR